MDEALERLIKSATLIEAGFAAFRRQHLDSRLPPEQVEEVRRVYFAGAQHLLYLLCRVLDDGAAEPTRSNLHCMNAIADEIAAFSAAHLPVSGSA